MSTWAMSTSIDATRRAGPFRLSGLGVPCEHPNRTLAPIGCAAMAGPTIGLFAINSHACASPGAAARIGTLAERLGYDSLWAGEHVVVPSPRVEPSPMEPGEPILDPLVALAHVAAHTERIRLGTGVIILPQRNPLVLAKQVASLDVLCGGRLILGIGVAYLEPEMRAIGVPMEGRGTRADEYLAAMRALWEEAAPSYSGRYVEFDGVDAHPRPVQRPLPVWVTRARRLEAETVGAYPGGGVDGLIAAPPVDLSLDELVEFVEANAPERLGGTPAWPPRYAGWWIRPTRR